MSDSPATLPAIEFVGPTVDFDKWWEAYQFAGDPQFTAYAKAASAWESAHRLYAVDRPAEIRRLKGVIESALESVNTPGTTEDNLALAINAKIMERDGFHRKTMAERDKLKGFYDEIVKECGDDQVLARLRSMAQARDDWKDLHDSIKRQADAQIKELMRKNGTLADRSHELERMLPELQSQLTEAWQKNGALESRLAALTPRSVAVKPTVEDGDVDDDIIVFFKCGNGNIGFAARTWDSGFDETDLCWLPGSLARLAPELFPKPVDKERATFEAWVLGEWPHTKMERTPSGYSHACIDNHWKGWQARAGKEAADGQ